MITGTGAAGNGPSRSNPEAQALDAVRRALREIEFGSVLIKIHQGEVVGIETSTKVRLKGS
jgi:hypothetical protein